MFPVYRSVRDVVVSIVLSGRFLVTVGLFASPLDCASKTGGRSETYSFLLKKDRGSLSDQPEDEGIKESFSSPKLDGGERSFRIVENNQLRWRKLSERKVEVAILCNLLLRQGLRDGTFVCDVKSCSQEGEEPRETGRWFGRSKEPWYRTLTP